MNDRMTQPTTKELIYLAAQNLLAHHAAGRKCDPEGLAWARWIVRHNGPHPDRTPIDGATARPTGSKT
jgi:hypothetical protein